MTWIATIPPEQLEPEGMASAQAGTIWVVLYRAEDNVYATSVMCTHGQASLADGYLEGFVIECPLHQGLFDIRTGEAVGLPCTEAIKTFPVRLNNGVLEVKVADEEGS
jgi:naphthalene 1,2-dioxygenase system ferredoxin subunit